MLGLETELAVRLGSPRHRNRTHRLVDAIDEQLAPHGVINGGGGGDGGLFNGILARYLALTAVMLPWESPADIRAREIAAQLVLTSAESAWENRLQIEGQPLFGHDWTKQAQLPGMGGGIATFTGGTVRSSRDPGTRHVRPARRLDADGGRAFRGLGREELRRRVRDRNRLRPRDDHHRDERHHRDETPPRRPRPEGTIPMAEPGGWSPDVKTIAEATVTRFMDWLRDTGRGDYRRLSGVVVGVGQRCRMVLGRRLEVLRRAVRHTCRQRAHHLGNAWRTMVSRRQAELRRPSVPARHRRASGHGGGRRGRLDGLVVAAAAQRDCRVRRVSARHRRGRG